MRVALISDIHANAGALEAVLADIRRVGADQIVCLGDVATLGPRPGAVIALLRDLGCPCIMGNHDDFLLEPELVRRYTDVAVVIDAVDWCRARLSTAELDFVRGFGATLELSLGAGSTLLLYHGTPRSNTEDLQATTPSDQLDACLAGRSATVMAGGHTHIQMLRQHHGMLLVNPGSVGLPFKDHICGGPPTILPYAEYAIVAGGADGVAVSLRRVPLDKRALYDAVAAPEWPLREYLMVQYA